MIANDGTPKTKVMCLLGAGSSADAGVPTAGTLTSTFAEFSRHFEDDGAILIENVFRTLQAHVGRIGNTPASTIDFEAVIGILVDVANGFQPVPEVLLGMVDRDSAHSLVLRALRIMCEFLRLREGTPAYLANLLSLRPRGTELDIFTLNFDTTIEEMLSATKTRFTDGFPTLRRPNEWAIWDPSEFDKPRRTVRLFKLHGSLGWAVVQIGPRPTSADATIDMEDYLTAYRRLVRRSGTQLSNLELPGSDLGPALAINVGTRKELMYTATPFSELFQRFATGLAHSDVCIVAGYSFRDKRVNAMIEEAMVERRGGLKMVVVDPSVFSLDEEFPALIEFRAGGVAQLIASPLKDALSTGSVKTAVRDILRTEPASKVGAWGSKLVVPENSVEPARHPKVVEAWWRNLGTALDAYPVHFGQLERMVHLWESTERASAIEAVSCLAPFVEWTSMAMLAMDKLMEGMGFPDYFGSAARAQARLSPRQEHQPHATNDIVAAAKRVSEWSAYVCRTYYYSTDEFVRGTADPEYGQGTSAPDNFSMVELVSREVYGRLGEVIYALNEVHDALGYEVPFPHKPLQKPG